MDQKHDLISQLKDLAIELGRTPTQMEFTTRVRGGNYRIKKYFGNYTILVQAAGLDTYDDRRCKKIDKSIFETDIEAHLENYKPKEIPENADSKLLRGLFLGDIHFPFSNDDLIERAVRFAEKEQPEIIVQGGDLYDMYSHVKFPRSHNVFIPREEEALARKKAETMWSELRRVCPNARCVQLWGNHDARPLKRVLEAYPEAEDWIKERLNKLMSFNGVELIDDYRQELLLPGNVMVHHGYRSQLGQHRDYVHMNAIVHHTHTGGVVFKQIHGRTLFELNAGYMADPNAKGLTYTPQRITHWTNGIGWTDEYGPRFIPAHNL